MALSLSRRRALTSNHGAALHPMALRPVSSRQSIAQPAQLSNLACWSSGRDVVDGWLDLAKLVTSAGGSNKTAYEDLASSIGRDIYVDIGGWHLFLRDLSAAAGLKMNQALAAKFGPQANDRIRESDVEEVLKQVPVKLGAGRTKVSLLDVMPSTNVRDLTRILEDYARNKK